MHNNFFSTLSQWDVPDFNHCGTQYFDAKIASSVIPYGCSKCQRNISFSTPMILLECKAKNDYSVQNIEYKFLPCQIF